MNYLLSIYFCFMCLLSLSCQPPKSAETRISLTKSLDSLIEDMHTHNQFDGTLLVGNKEQVLFTKAVGSANRTYNIPMAVNHRFDIASLNKSFTAALVLLAVEEGKIDLNDKLQDLLGAFPYSGKLDSSITIHQLLSHTSGLPDYNSVSEELSENNFLKFKRMRFSNEEYVDFISQLPPVNQPGKQFYYSNFGYHLLAIVLEDRYQQSFSELLQEKICQPLDLRDTFAPQTNEEVHQAVVEGYNYSRQQDQWKRNNFIDLSLGRRIFSSVEDLYKWGKAMDNTSLLSSESLKLMKTNHLSALTKELSYGYGWVVFDGGGSYQMGNLLIHKPYLIHGGATEGYKSMLVNIDQGEYIIAFLSNVGSQTNEMELAKKIAHILTQTNHEN